MSYETERDTAAAQLRTVASEVVRILNDNGLGGPAWEVEDIKNEEMRISHINLVSGTGPTRAELSVWRGRPSGREGERFVVRPVWPRVRNDYYRPYNTAVGEITVAATATPERLAAEIARRLLPGYLAELAGARDKVAADDAAWASRRELAAIVCSVWGSTAWSCNRNPETDEELRIRHPGDAEAKARPYSGVTFTVTAKDPTQVRLIAQAINAALALAEPEEVGA